MYATYQKFESKLQTVRIRRMEIVLVMQEIKTVWKTQKIEKREETKIKRHKTIICFQIDMSFYLSNELPFAYIY